MLKSSNIIIGTILLFCFGFLCSCTDKNPDEKKAYNWGTTKMYPDFPLCSYKPVLMEHELSVSFNEDAVKRPESLHPFKLGLFEMDDEGQYVVVSPSDIVLYKNGQKQNGTQFNIGLEDMDSDGNGDVKIAFEFTREAKEGLHIIYVRVLDYGGLDRVKDNEEGAEKPVDIWKAEKENVMNPLAKALMWIGILLGCALVAWLFILKPILISTFKVGRLMISDPYYSNQSIHRARRIIFTNKTGAKDSFIKKIFLGRTVYEINPLWATELEGLPGQGETVRLRCGMNYVVDPYATSLQKGEEYTIQNLQTQDRIKILLM